MINKSLFAKLFILEMANNHMGDVKHGLNIIQELHKICNHNDFADFKFAFKFQYRNLKTFIHPDYINRTGLKYVKRFLETNLSESERLLLKEEAQKLGFITICTPFDEDSVDLIIKHEYDIIKVASCSFTDWPLLEKIVQKDKPLFLSPDIPHISYAFLADCNHKEILSGSDEYKLISYLLLFNATCLSKTFS